MNDEKAVKKLAEVAAIINLCGMLDGRTGGRLKRELLDDTGLWERLDVAELRTYVPAGFDEVFMKKLVRTESKIAGMMEMYIGDEWDNDLEVLEWCGFQFGAGAVHAALVGGLTGDGDDSLQELAADIRSAFSGLLDAAGDRLADLGRGA
jgi:hypothetical protein